MEAIPLPFQSRSLSLIFSLRSLFCYYPEHSSRTNKVVITCNSARGGLKLVRWSAYLRMVLSKHRQKTPLSPVETLGRSSVTLRVKLTLDCLFSWHLIFPRCAVEDYIFTLNCLIKTFLKHSFGIQSSWDALFLSSLTPVIRENLHEKVWSWKLKSKTKNVGVKSMSQVTEIYGWWSEI